MVESTLIKRRCWYLNITEHNIREELNNTLARLSLLPHQAPVHEALDLNAWHCYLHMSGRLMSSAFSSNTISDKTVGMAGRKWSWVGISDFCGPAIMSLCQEIYTVKGWLCFIYL